MVEHMQYLGFWTPGPLEIIVILIVALLIFGKRLPEVGRGLAKFLTEFKKGLHEVEKTTDEVVDEVNKVKDDIVKETKDATGMNDLNNKD